MGASALVFDPPRLLLLEEERALRRANDAIVSYLLSQPVSKQGDGYEACTDLMSLWM
jgi:hypothetical protein